MEGPRIGVDGEGGGLQLQEMVGGAHPTRFYSDLEFVGCEHEIKHIHNPIPVHVRLRLVRSKALSDCLNRGLRRLRGLGLAIARDLLSPWDLCRTHYPFV